MRREAKTLGKRSAMVEPAEAKALEEAISREIQRKRRSSVGREAPVTLDERRAADRANITAIIKENANLLVSWKEILAVAL